MSRPTHEQIRAAGEKAMKDMRAEFGPSANAGVIDLAEQRRRNALFVIDVLLRAYVPKNTNDWREMEAAFKALSEAALSAAPAEGVRMLTMTEVDAVTSLRARDTYEDYANVQKRFCEVNAGKTIPATGMAEPGAQE